MRRMLIEALVGLSAMSLASFALAQQSKPMKQPATTKAKTAPVAAMPKAKANASTAATVAKGKVPPVPTATAAMTIIPLTNMLVNGKKVWLPGEIKAPHGKVKFVLNNTLEEPHGFQVPGVMAQGVVVPPKKSMEVMADLPAKKKYELKCHMHPAHVSAYVETY